jgi:hypothetical protein
MPKPRIQTIPKMEPINFQGTLPKYIKTKLVKKMMMLVEKLDSMINAQVMIMARNIF